MEVYTPQLGLLIMDDGREFGDEACTRIPPIRPTSVRLAVQGAPEREGLRTVAEVSQADFNLGTAIKKAAEEGLFWVAAPRDLDDPLTMIVDAAAAAAQVLDSENPGFAIALNNTGWDYQRVAVVLDVANPITTGVMAWAAVGLAVRWGAELDLLVLGVDNDSEEESESREDRLARFTIRGTGLDLVRTALERADEHGIEIGWKPLGNPANRPGAVLRAVVEGEYDAVVDDLPPINVGPKLGRRRRVESALSKSGADAIAYRLIRDSPASVVLVLDAVRMGVVPEEMMKAGVAATLALGVVGSGGAALMGDGGSGTQAALTPKDATAAAAVEEAANVVAAAPVATEAGLDVTSMTRADLAELQATLNHAIAVRDSESAIVAQQQANQALAAEKLAAAEAEADAVDAKVDMLKTSADEAAQEGARAELLTRGPLQRLPFTPSQAEAEAAQQRAEQAARAAETAQVRQEQLVTEKEAWSENLAQVDAAIAEHQAAAENAQQQAEVLSAKTAEVNQFVNRRVIPTTDGFQITATFRQAGPWWSRGWHTGLDFANSTGTPIFAAKDGVVTQSGWGGAYGNLIVIQHDDGTTTWYAHNSQMFVSPGQRVSAGDHIAAMGATGNVTGPHLHFEVRDSSDNFLDPAAWLGM